MSSDIDRGDLPTHLWIWLLGHPIQEVQPASTAESGYIDAGDWLLSTRFSFPSAVHASIFLARHAEELKLRVRNTVRTGMIMPCFQHCLTRLPTSVDDHAMDLDLAMATSSGPSVPCCMHSRFDTPLGTTDGMVALTSDEGGGDHLVLPGDRSFRFATRAITYASELQQLYLQCHSGRSSPGGEVSWSLRLYPQGRAQCLPTGRHLEYQSTVVCRLYFQGTSIADAVELFENAEVQRHTLDLGSRQL